MTTLPILNKIYCLNLEMSNMVGAAGLKLPKELSLVNLSSSNIKYAELMIFVQ